MDATQEMLTLGLCNMAGSLVHAMPTCGAFTRSAVSHSSGVRTPAAGLYSGTVVRHPSGFEKYSFDNKRAHRILLQSNNSARLCDLVYRKLSNHPVAFICHKAICVGVDLKTLSTKNMKVTVDSETIVNHY